MKIIIPFLLMMGCTFPTKNIKKEAITAAIIQFQKNELYKDNSIFFICYHDTVMNESNVEIGESYEDLIAVSFFLPQEPFYVSKEYGYDLENSILPSSYLIIDNKLFYWYDNNIPQSKETLDILTKYNLIYILSELSISKNEDSLAITDIDSITSPKVVHQLNNRTGSVDYFFCRNDLSIFKEIESDVAFGYYEIPVLNCKCSD